MRPFYSLRFFFLLLLFSLFGSEQSQAQVSEGLVPDETELRVLRQYVRENLSLAAWESVQNTPLASFPAIRLENGDVVEIFGGYGQLTGNVPACLGELTQLQVLTFTQNQLTGPIPDSYRHLTKLRRLDLDQNQISGDFPQWLGSLPLLEQVNLNHNRLTGSLPNSLGGLTALRTLMVRDNRLTGTLPASLGQLSNLTALHLGYNQLQGSIPVELGDLQSLMQLDLSYNQLSGAIPHTLGNLTHLAELHLSHNRLYGRLPGSLWQIPYLNRLDASYNQLTGTLADSAGLQQRLYFVFLQHNRFSGALPPSIGLMAGLSQLDLSYNQFAEELPPQWGDLPYLGYLWLNNNRLTGSIPARWSNMLGLNQLFLDDNRLSGAIPASLTTLPRLYLLTLRRNNLTSLPSWAAVAAAAGTVPTVLAGENYLDFGSIQPNFTPEGTSCIPGFEFLPQRVGPTVTETCVVGAVKTLSVQMGGLYNHYQWERLVGQSWVECPGQTSTELSLGAVTSAMEGLYRVRVWNEHVKMAWIGHPSLYTASIDLDVLPYAALPLNEPVAADCPEPASIPALSNRTAGQTDPVNYVRTRVARRAYTNPTRLDQAGVDSVQVKTEYLDGLGRVVQTVLKQESPQRRDLVQPIVYDALGRQPRQFLPYSAAGTADLVGYYPNARGEQEQFYRGTSTNATVQAITATLPKTSFAFTATAFEPSPLGRVLAQGSPGESWMLTAGHAVTLWERPNTARDTVYRWLPGYESQREELTFQQPYAAGELWATLTHDEGGHLSQTFTDKQGHIVLKQVAERIGADTTWLKTYYVYDDFERLRAVLPPTAVQRIRKNALGAGLVEGAGVERLLFRYHYDAQGRLIEKQVPDTDGYTYLVYDELNRPILTQDVAQRERSEWVATKFDELGRTVLTALLSRPGVSRSVLQTQAASASLVWEVPSTTAFLSRAYYTNQSYPVLTSGDQLLTITYYDGYDFDQNGVANATYEPATEQQLGGPVPVADTRLTGQTTSTEVRVLGVVDTDPNAWLKSISFYDEQLRPIQIVATNARGGTDVVSSRYDFAGKVLGTYTTHTDRNHDPITVQETPSYDHAGRLLSSTQRLNDAAPVTLATQQYNELGQVEQKVVGGQLQTVDYRYNIRGWLTQINNPEQLQTDDLWSMSLHYDCGFEDKQYNGNIAGQRWRSKSDNVERAYGYRYDNLNRVLQGDFVAKGPAATSWEEERNNYRFWAASYDANGNLLSLRRRGLLQEATRNAPRQYGVTDNIRYRYTATSGTEPVSNRLLRVDDLAAAAPVAAAGQPARPDFQDGTTSGSTQADYTYDVAGSMTSDRNKGITRIQYNYLHLPEVIEWQSGSKLNKLQYLYTATGQKVAKLATEDTKPTVRTDYLGAWQYERDSLRWMNHSEGRVLRLFTRDVSRQPVIRYSYEYTLKDHLGNLRVAFHQGITDGDTATLEPVVAARERRLFDAASISAPIIRNDGTAYSGNFAAVLNAGGTSPTPLGPFKQLAVAKGDAVQAKVQAHYLQRVQQSNWGFTLAGFIAGLLQQPAPTGPTGPDGSGKVKVFPLLSIALNSTIIQTLEQLPEGVPQAYIRILVFNQDSVLVSQETRQIGKEAGPGYGWQEVSVEVTAVGQAGYVQVYVANESNTDVYFDDLIVVHQQGLQVQENHYDPFGLDLVGLSKSATPENMYTFNGKEKQTEFDLNWQDYGARMYNPAIGRWNTVDPLAEQFSFITPYNFSYNNAVRFVDPDGRAVDQYFDPNGKYLADDGQGTKVRVIEEKKFNEITDNGSKTAEKSQELKSDDNSKLFADADISVQASLNIYQHYNPTDLKLSNTDNPDANMAFTPTPGKEQIQVNVAKEKRQGYSNDYMNIKSTFSHEDKHYKDYKTAGAAQHNSTSHSLRERRAYQYQMDQPAFQQTTPSYQRAVRAAAEKPKNGPAIFPLAPRAVNVVIPTP